jgi:uncharacterized membrane protein YdjX (TVP38/TMEM64 family)
LLFFACTFSVFLYAIHVVEFTVPVKGSPHPAVVRFPRAPQEVLQVSQTLYQYASENLVQTLAIFFCLYVALQAFSVPGSVFLSVLSGALFPFPLAVFMTLLAASCGASSAFLLSGSFARPVATALLGPARLDKLRNLVQGQSAGALFFILLGSRISPVLPNWALNNGCSLVGVPLSAFFLSTFVGLIPVTLIHVTAGSQLRDGGMGLLESPFTVLGLLTVLGSLAFLPGYLLAKWNARSKALQASASLKKE